MNPVPDQTRHLPPNPDLDQLRRQAKELLNEARSGSEHARSRLGDVATPCLADAQFALAREHGFASWPRLKAALDGAHGAVRRAEIPDRHLQPTTFGPKQFLDSARRSGWSPGRLPKTLVFAFQHVIARVLEASDDFSEQPEMAVGNGRFFISATDPAIAVSCMSPGSAFVGQVENQVALGGASEFVIVNLAGGLGPDTTSGSVAVVESAVRDDGLSDHYLGPGDVVDADDDLTERLLHSVRTVDPATRRHVSWTNPAVFRQIQAERDHYASQGVTIVESEIASLFAVCRALGVAASAVVVITGNPDVGDMVDWPAIAATQQRVFDAVVTTT